MTVYTDDILLVINDKDKLNNIDLILLVKLRWKKYGLNRIRSENRY